MATHRLCRSLESTGARPRHKGKRARLTGSIRLLRGGAVVANGLAFYANTGLLFAIELGLRLRLIQLLLLFCRAWHPSLPCASRRVC